MENQRSIYSNNIIKTDAAPPAPPKEKRRKHASICQQPAVATATIGSTFQQLDIPKDLLTATDYPIETAQKWFTLPGKNGKSHTFPLQSILPKVQMMRVVPPKQLPRDVQVDRRRRNYAQINLLETLEAAGITNEELQPTEEQYYLLSKDAFKHFLPLSFFDNTDFDCHSEEAWIKQGLVDSQQYALPAKVYLPSANNLIDYDWHYAAVQSYDAESNKWTVLHLMDEQVYQVPKIQIMFLAENPHYFVQRLKCAVNARNTAESLLKMETIVDCVLLQDLRDNRFFPNNIVEKLLKQFAASPAFMASIRLEIYLLFEHLMACCEFDKFVKLMPKEFPTFSGDFIRNALPKAHHSPSSVYECKMVKNLKLDIARTRHNVLKTTLYYIGGGIEAMLNVATECQYVETLSLFVCSFAKALPLNDFLQSQQSHSNNVTAYLKNFWPQQLSGGICLNLRALGRGWLDISLSKWTVYQMCKISRFILQTRFRMQESMQVLLERSIENISRFLTDPCIQFLSVEAFYKWPENQFIRSVFPYHKPIFSLVIGVSKDEQIFYSTPPEHFEPALLDIFKKVLEMTSGIRCIDAETLSNLRFAPNLYIETVELIEDLYIKHDELLHNCYSQAIIPLIAYSKLYERFIPFYLLNVNDYMRDYEAAKKSSVQVKTDILNHKRQKEELREILPATITIGPFLIIVDPMKQLMIRKHIDIVKRLFEYYVVRMYDANEALMERCVELYTKIAERPQSIEHLNEIRDLALTVPGVVEQLKADIQIMWLEYEMLEGFFYNLSDHQFSLKWQVYAMPHTILQRLLPLKEEQKVDIEEFKRIHISECIGFEERLESLNEEIQAFSLQFDASKVLETIVDVKKTWKIIKELKKLGETLKYRQTLFELEELSLEFLESIIEGFTPYMILWYACADLVKLEEATVGNPLINIELADIWLAMQEIRSSLNKSYEIFNEKVEIQSIATTFLEKLDQFYVVYNCITWLKNENWLFMHWQELAKISGIELKYSVAMNFLYCMRKGIMDHLDLVHEISLRAESDADAYRKTCEEEERLKEEARVNFLMRKALRKCRTDIL